MGIDNTGWINGDGTSYIGNIPIEGGKYPKTHISPTNLNDPFLVANYVKKIMENKNTSQEKDTNIGKINKLLWRTYKTRNNKPK